MAIQPYYIAKANLIINGFPNKETITRDEFPISYGDEVDILEDILNVAKNNAKLTHLTVIKVMPG